MSSSSKISPSVLLLLLLGVAVAFAGSMSVLSTVQGNVQVLSVSNIDFASSSSFFNEPTTAVEFIQGGLGQTITGTLEADEIADEDKVAEKGFTFNVKPQAFLARFPVVEDPDAQKIYNYEMKNIGQFGDPSTDCAPLGEVVETYQCGFLANKICLIKNKGGAHIAQFSENPDITFRTDFELQVDGESSQVGILRSQESSQVQISDDAWVTWTGNLQTGTAPPSASESDVMAVFSTIEGVDDKWRLTDKSDYQQYTQKANILESLSCSDLSSEQDLQNEITEVNQQAALALQPDAWTTDTGIEGTIEKAADVQNAEVAFDLYESGRQLQIPQFQLLIKSSTLQVKQAVPDPQIQSVEDLDIGANEVGVVEAQVKNIGESGNIQLALESCGAVSQQGRFTELNVEAGETKLFSLAVVGKSSTQEQTEECSVEASSLAKTDTETFSVTVKPNFVCNDGETRAISKEIQECQNNQWVTIETCDEGQEPKVQNGQLTCVDEGGGNGGGGILGGLKKLLAGLIPGLNLDSFAGPLGGVLAVVGGIFIAIISILLLVLLIRVVSFFK